MRWQWMILVLGSATFCAGAQGAGDSAAPTSAAAQTSSSSADQGEPVRRATPAELRSLAEHVAFLRGRYAREAIGMRMDIPRGQHLLAGAEARRADIALRGVDDAHLIGWMIADNKNLTDANLHIVRLRWRHDGLVAGDAATLEPAALLDAAHAQPRVPRLAGTDGALLRYVDAPVREGSTVIWSEERQPENAKTSVFDCHALRLARKGVLEISIVGADAKAAKSCVGELGALAATVHFEAESDYPARIQGERLATYSLSGMITQTQ
jgi:hypothetical protein